MVKSAAASEALAESVPVTFKGHTYGVIPSSEWPLEAIEAFEDGKVATFVRSILPADDYAAFKATSPKVSDLGPFVEAIRKGLGISGN